MARRQFTCISCPPTPVEARAASPNCSQGRLARQRLKPVAAAINHWHVARIPPAAPRAAAINHWHVARIPPAAPWAAAINQWHVARIPPPRKSWRWAGSGGKGSGVGRAGRCSCLDCRNQHVFRQFSSSFQSVRAPSNFQAFFRQFSSSLRVKQCSSSF